jgi:SecDF, P1 head subdomain
MPWRMRLALTPKSKAYAMRHVPRLSAIILTCALAGCAPGYRQVAPGVSIGFHAADTEPFPGSVESFDSRRNRKVFVHPESRITQGDIKKVTHITIGPNDEILISFTVSGAEKMRRFSHERDGKMVAILVNGRVVYVPIVRGDLSAGLAMGGMTESAAIDLFEVLTRGKRAHREPEVELLQEAASAALPGARIMRNVRRAYPFLR